MTKVQLGFVDPTGEPYFLPIHHTGITGMSDLSGKTTAAEARFRRAAAISKRKILVFLTKRGEKTFLDANRVQPYYKERADWEYIRGLLEAAWHERLKFETPWLYDICRKPHHAKDLEEVFDRLGEVINNPKQTLIKVKDFDIKIFTSLYAYMEKIIPALKAARTKLTDHFELKPGMNVMDLTPWYQQEAFQMIIIRSCMDHILEKENDIDVGLPEAWKMLPQGRNTPVKLVFEKFIREGATNGNFLLIDAQDLGGVDKVPLRQVSLWIIGKMMQADEVQRLLEQIPGAKIKSEDIQTLELGHFYVVNGIDNTVAKIYVWPWGIPEDLARSVAKGNVRPETVKELLLEQRKAELLKQSKGDGVYGFLELKNELSSLHQAVERNEERRVEVTKVQKQDIDDLKKRMNSMEVVLEQTIPALQKMRLEGQPLEDNLTLVQVKKNVKIAPIELDFKLTTETAAGKIMWLAKEGFFEEWHSQTEIEHELVNKHAWAMPRITLFKALEKLVTDGYLGKMQGRPAKFKLSDMVNMVE